MQPLDEVLNMHYFYLLIGSSGLIVFVRLALSLVRHFTSPLRSVPGPFLARYTDGWYMWRVSKGLFEAENLELHKKYGPIVRYGPNRFSISDTEASKVIYGHGTRFPKSPWYSAWASPGAWSIFADQSIERHAHNRRLYQHAYSMTSLVTFEPYVDQCADLFSQHLAAMAEARVDVDMGHWFQCYAFDVIGLMTYGRRLGFLDSGSDIGGVIAALEDHLVYATLVGIYSEWHRYLYRILNFWAGRKGSGRAYVISFTKEVVTQYRERAKTVSSDSNPYGQGLSKDQKVAEPFLSKFMAKHEEDPAIFTSEHITVGLAANMVAGSDTTAISLSAILYYMLVTAGCVEKLRKEIEIFEAEGRLSWPPTFKQTQQMPYLQAVLKEALRIHPATGLPLERVVPKGGSTICGRFFPEGSIVGINTWVEHRNPLIFGDDADTFRPERWLESDEGRIALMNRHWMPFGLGSRTCIGRHISWLEMSKLIPRIVRDFDFELVGETANGQMHWTTINYWFVKPKDFRVRVVQRRTSRQGTDKQT